MFHKVFTNLYFHQQSMRVLFTHSHQHLLFLVSLIIATFTVVRWYLIWFWFVFLCWLLKLCIFSSVCSPFLWLILRSVCLLLWRKLSNFEQNCIESMDYFGYYDHLNNMILFMNTIFLCNVVSFIILLVVYCFSEIFYFLG